MDVHFNMNDFVHVITLTSNICTTEVPLPVKGLIFSQEGRINCSPKSITLLIRPFLALAAATCVGSPYAWNPRIMAFGMSSRYEAQIHVIFLANDVLLKRSFAATPSAEGKENAVARAFRPALPIMFHSAYQVGAGAPEVRVCLPSQSLNKHDLGMLCRCQIPSKIGATRQGICIKAGHPAPPAICMHQSREAVCASQGRGVHGDWGGGGGGENVDQYSLKARLHYFLKNVHQQFCWEGIF